MVVDNIVNYLALYTAIQCPDIGTKSLISLINREDVMTASDFYNSKIFVREKGKRKRKTIMSLLKLAKEKLEKEEQNDIAHKDGYLNKQTKARRELILKLYREGKL